MRGVFVARVFNNKAVELLAPAGTFEIYKEVVKANCDAIYLGGKSLNMRMIRTGYNFSDQEIAEAIKMAHTLDKKVYITVNNLINNVEIDEAKRYLTFLKEANADGVIVQDLGVVKIINDLQLDYDIHASVMMNVHNIPMVEALQACGLTRTIVSREMDLLTVKHLQLKTGIEVEYFMHGDMCTVHGANCLYSSIVFGNSSNRGRCFKPCRWDFQLKHGGKLYPAEYPLAAKDMYMYEHIPELINANVVSFKIEGRMRSADFIVGLVNTYGAAIDSYIEDPLAFDRYKEADFLHNDRKRDFSTAYAFGNPGLSYINRRYEGTGKFYSTGKVFSIPTQEPDASSAEYTRIKEALRSINLSKNHVPLLTARVNTIEQAKLCIEQKLARIYIQTEVFQPHKPFTINDIQELRDLADSLGDTELYLAMPRMMTDLHLEQFDHYLMRYGDLFDGLLVTNLGAVHKYKQYNLIGDFTLNIYNNEARDFYIQKGVSIFTHSIEKKLSEFIDFVENNEQSAELVIHGQPVTMYSELDLFANLEKYQPTKDEKNLNVDEQTLVLKSEAGELPVYRDQAGRNHITMVKELCYLPLLREFRDAGVKYMRIEAMSYNVEELSTIIIAYKKALNNLNALDEYNECTQLLKSVRAGFSVGAMAF